MAEFALVLPVLLMVLFGIAEIGIAITQAQAVEAAAREGGRLASLSSSTVSDVENRVDASLAVIPLDGPASVTVSPSDCDGREGESVVVTVATPHDITVPLLVDRTITLTGQAVFRCEA